MQHEDFRAALEVGDFKLVRKMAAVFMAHLPQPKNDAEAEAVMHGARTSAEFITFKARAYSHRWLSERGLPSQLPDQLKPSAERLYPRVVEGVGIAMQMKDPLLKPALLQVRGAMENVVADMYANGDTDPVRVKRRMLRARERAMIQLFGSVRAPAS